MTCQQAFTQITNRLQEAGCDSPAFDASCLLEHFTGMSRGRLPLHGGENLRPAVCDKLMEAAAQRAGGRPLQYILGEWDFLSLTLEVGEGVLIPRPDTERLCEVAADKLRGRGAARVLDLCAGSGCVGLGISSLCPPVSVTAVELSEQAFGYLQRNCARYPEFDVTPVRGDVLTQSGLNIPDGPVFDAIVSNPPYIPTADLPSLMREVQHEPRMALDGGDGLVFYRAIACDWVKRLAPGGFCAVEAGIGQAADIAALWQAAGLCRIAVVRDYGGIDRVVVGDRPAD